MPEPRRRRLASASAVVPTVGNPSGMAATPSAAALRKSAWSDLRRARPTTITADELASAKVAGRRPIQASSCSSGGGALGLAGERALDVPGAVHRPVATTTAAPLARGDRGAGVHHAAALGERRAASTLAARFSGGLALAGQRAFSSAASALRIRTRASAATGSPARSASTSPGTSSGGEPPARAVAHDARPPTRSSPTRAGAPLRATRCTYRSRRSRRRRGGRRRRRSRSPSASDRPAAPRSIAVGTVKILPGEDLNRRAGRDGELVRGRPRGGGGASAARAPSRRSTP